MLSVFLVCYCYAAGVCHTFAVCCSDLLFLLEDLVSAVPGKNAEF